MGADFYFYATSYADTPLDALNELPFVNTTLHISAHLSNKS